MISGIGEGWIGAGLMAIATAVVFTRRKPAAQCGGLHLADATALRPVGTQAFILPSTHSDFVAVARFRPRPRPHSPQPHPVPGRFQAPFPPRRRVMSEHDLSRRRPSAVRCGAWRTSKRPIGAPRSRPSSLPAERSDAARWQRLRCASSWRRRAVARWVDAGFAPCSSRRSPTASRNAYP
jgi:hypothetical protein